MEYEDITLTCVEEECGHAQYQITAGEQEFFAGKGFQVPKRCKECRERKRNRQNSAFADVAKEFKNNRRHGRERGNDWEK